MRPARQVNGKMGDLLINFDASQNEEATRNESEQYSASLADNPPPPPDPKSADLLTNDLQASPDLAGEHKPDGTANDANHLKSKDLNCLESKDVNYLEPNDVNHQEPASLEEKPDEHDSIESRDSEKKKVLQELNQRIIDEQKLNSELISKLHIQLDNAISEKEDLARKLNEKESDLSEVETILKQQKERLKQLEDVESTNSKLKALAVKLKKQLAEVKEDVSVWNHM